jgi:hypothetical protein
MSWKLVHPLESRRYGSTVGIVLGLVDFAGLGSFPGCSDPGMERDHGPGYRHDP